MQTTVSVFATRDEIQTWLACQAERFDLHFALVRHWPEFSVIPLMDWQHFKEQEQAVQAREVWIDLRPVRHQCKGQLDCCDKNHDRLALQLPQLGPEGLREGSLGTLAADEVHLRVWRSIIRYFRGHTTAGVWVVNPASNARVFYNRIRYSPGIAALHRNGLQLLPFAGRSRGFIEESLQS
jgi:hypothetical protein